MTTDQNLQIGNLQCLMNAMFPQYMGTESVNSARTRIHLRAIPGRRERAFTLVELLVVISILAVLISLLLPALNRAKALAQAIECASNLQQIGLAALEYTNESQGLVPNQPFAFGPGGQGLTWDIQISPELGMHYTERQMLYGLSLSEGDPHMICPSDPTELVPITDTHLLPYQRPAWHPLLSYAMPQSPYVPPGPAIENNNSLGSPIVPGTSNLMLIAALPHPANEIYVTDAYGCHYFQDYRNYFFNWVRNQQGVSGPHQGDFNYVFLDAHVETLPYVSTIGSGNLTWPSGMWTVNGH